MVDNENTKAIYSKIQKHLLYMIPEKWNRICLYASVTEKINNLQTGELFFYYFPKGILKKKPVNSYEIPAKFNLDEDEYIKLIEGLYCLIKSLREEFRVNQEELWTSLTIKIEKFHFIVEFNYEDKIQDEEKRHLIWSYENLKIPLESYTKKQKLFIMQYLQKNKKEPSKIEIHKEPIYTNQIKNVVQYNHEKVEFATQKHQNLKKENKNLKANSYKKQYLEKSKFIKDAAKKEKLLMSAEPKLSLEEQIQMQQHAVKSQILKHN